MNETRYAVMFEKSNTGYGAYAPDLPGWIATGSTLALTRRRMCEAIAAHLRAMREDGDPLPQPSHVEVLEPVANLTAFKAPSIKRSLGWARGEFTVPPDFDHPLPPDVEENFYR